MFLNEVLYYIIRKKFLMLKLLWYFNVENVKMYVLRLFFLF